MALALQYYTTIIEHILEDADPSYSSHKRSFLPTINAMLLEVDPIQHPTWYRRRDGVMICKRYEMTS